MSRSILPFSLIIDEKNLQESIKKTGQAPRIGIFTQRTYEFSADGCFCLPVHL